MSPRSKRDVMKRSAAQIINHQAKVVLQLAELAEKFKTHHPDLADYLEQCAINENATRDAFLAFVQKAWMLDENDLMSWF
jgi:hypothetical protein